MKRPTKCGIVPIKLRKSWGPIKRRSSKSCLPEKNSCFPHILDQFPPSRQCPTLRPPPPPVASAEEIPEFKNSCG